MKSTSLSLISDLIYENMWNEEISLYCNTIQRSRLPCSLEQGGITCEAIDEPRKSSKAIDERVIINFRDKNVVIARFRDKNVVIVISVLSIAFLFYKYGKYI